MPIGKTNLATTTIGLWWSIPILLAIGVGPHNPKPDMIGLDAGLIPNLTPDTLNQFIYVLHMQSRLHVIVIQVECLYCLTGFHCLRRKNHLKLLLGTFSGYFLKSKNFDYCFGKFFE